MDQNRNVRPQSGWAKAADNSIRRAYAARTQQLKPQPQTGPTYQGRPLDSYTMNVPTIHKIYQVRPTVVFRSKVL